MTRVKKTLALLSTRRRRAALAGSVVAVAAAGAVAVASPGDGASAQPPRAPAAQRPNPNDVSALDVAVPATKLSPEELGEKRRRPRQVSLAADPNEAPPAKPARVDAPAPAKADGASPKRERESLPGPSDAQIKRDIALLRHRMG